MQEKLILPAFIFAYFCKKFRWDMGIYHHIEAINWGMALNPFLKTQK